MSLRRRRPRATATLGSRSTIARGPAIWVLPNRHEFDGRSGRGRVQFRSPRPDALSQIQQPTGQPLTALAMKEGVRHRRVLSWLTIIPSAANVHDAFYLILRALTAIEAAVLHRRVGR